MFSKYVPKGYTEAVGYGMIGYAVPLSVYPQGWLGRTNEPLPFVGLASQKNYMSIYLMSVYMTKNGEKMFRQAYAKTGKKLRTWP